MGFVLGGGYRFGFGYRRCVGLGFGFGYRRCVGLGFSDGVIWVWLWWIWVSMVLVFRSRQAVGGSVWAMNV